MANLYTSGLIEYTGTEPIEVSVAEYTHDAPKIIIEHYTSGDVLIGEITPAWCAVENHDGVNTRHRVQPESGQLTNGEKIKIIVDDA